MTSDEARAWRHLHTADDIHRMREVVMVWSVRTGDMDGAARMAEGITARAVELGLERP